MSASPLARNDGQPLDLDVVRGIRVNKSAAERRAATIPTRRTVKKQWQAAWLLKAITLMDLTTLSGDDTEGNVKRLCAKARRPVRDDVLEKLGATKLGITVGAVCVYHQLVETAVKALEGSGIPVAAVSTGFPAGLSPFEQRLEEIDQSVRAGAKEIDIVITRAHVLTGNWEALYDEVKAFREACGDAHLKAILATGELATLTNVARASWVAMQAGADFIKTSTGKEGKTTCKCTKFAVESRVLKPGEQTKLVIDWTAGAAPDRAFRHGGPVYTNDPKNAEVNFVVEGAIDMPVELLPNLWSVGNINLDKTGTLRAAIASRLTDQWEVESVESPSGKVTVKVSPMSVEEIASEKWAKGFQFDVEIAADIPVGKFQEDIKINLRGVDQVPFVTAKLTARKYGNFILQPLEGAMFLPDKMVLHLGQFPSSEGRHVKLLLIVNEKDMTDPFQITDIEADPPFLKASIEPLGNSTGSVHRYAVEISVPPGRPHVQKTEFKSGHITIHTNHPSKEAIHAEVLMHSH